MRLSQRVAKNNVWANDSQGVQAIKEARPHKEGSRDHLTSDARKFDDGGLRTRIYQDCNPAAFAPGTGELVLDQSGSEAPHLMVDLLIRKRTVLCARI